MSLQRRKELPPAECYQTENAAVCNYLKIGGPGRDRTDDLFHAMEARSQLRHRPTAGKPKESALQSILAYLSRRVKLI
jgi:hypothetical protein